MSDDGWLDWPSPVTDEDVEYLKCPCCGSLIRAPILLERNPFYVAPLGRYVGAGALRPFLDTFDFDTHVRWCRVVADKRGSS